MASGDKPSSGKPVSGVGETLPAQSIQDTLPAALSEMSQPPHPADRPSRASIPPQPTTRYRLGEEIGRGGMGRVVEAFDTQLGRTVALKEVLPDGGTIVRRFVREIEITARLEHASIVPLYDSGTTADGRPFYVMKRVTGRPLDEEIRRASTLDERLMLLPSMLAAIDAIAHAHTRGVIHRDLKPGNILVGEDGQTVVIDWGLAKVIGEADEDMSGTVPSGDSLHTQIGSVFGTPGFMSPEQARGEELTPTVDVYALGATLYQLLAGKPPLGGSSATELIGKTLIHDVTPLANVVDGVPRELNAIVEKALSFDAGVRYKDASELAADVRRFQAGQLVAAHSYTRGQRFARFIHKNRGILVVASAAVVAVAIFGTYSVHRVLVERDVASEARAQALREKAAAESARDHLAERNDALVIERARSVLDTNPTLAAAMLLELPPSSPRMGDARAVAQAAAARGIWRGMEGPPGFQTWSELDAKAERLLSINRDGDLRVWDLDHSRLVIVRKYESDRRPTWAGSLIAVGGKSGPFELLDPAANRATQLPGLPLDDVSISNDGVTAIGIDTAKTLVRVDLQTGERTELWPGHATDDVRLAPDGSWLLAHDKTTVAAIDRDGHELATRDQGSVGLMRITGRNGVTITTAGALALTLDPTPVWTLIPPPDKNQFLVHGEWRSGGAFLDLVTVTGKIYWWNKANGIYPYTADLGVPAREPSAMGDDWFMVPTQDRIIVSAGDTQLSLPFPMALQQPRVAVKRGSSRIVVVSDGAILQMDVADLIPQSIPLHEDVTLVSPDTILRTPPSGEVEWLDVPTKAVTPVTIGEPLRVDQWEPATKRVIATSAFSKDPTIYLGKPGDPTFTPLIKGASAWATLVAPDSVLFGPGGQDERIELRDRDGKVREIAKTASPVVIPMKAAPNRAVLMTAKGELLRIDVRQGIVDRINIAPNKDTIIFPAGDDRVAIADGTRLSVWYRGAVTVVATFGKPIDVLAGLPDGTALVTLTDHTSWRVTLEANATPRPLQATAFMTANDESGQRAVAEIENHALEITDLATNARWSLPHVVDNNVIALQLPSPNVLALRVGGALLLWALPIADADLANWIHERTSAKVNSENQLVWPWQSAATP
ncbi:MAG TPA: serine/threonine-protein kinase [Kofleriaceae bacterium]|jgi:hypothetical protein